MFRKNEIEAIDFREFMAGNHHTQKQSPRTKNVRAMSAFFPVITPGSFFPIYDPVFALFLVGSNGESAHIPFPRQKSPPPPGGEKKIQTNPV